MFGKLFSIIFWLVFLSMVGFFVFKITRSICDKPLTYRLGLIDEKFNISEQEVKDELAKAEAIWETPTQLDLFRYDPKARFTINFIFDDRQAKTLKQQEQEGAIDDSKESFDLLQKQYTAKVAAYNSRLKSYNEEIAKFNSQGGAPPADFERLENERIALNKLGQEVNELASRLNRLASQLNLQIDRFNAQIGTPFDAGEFTGEEINIYQFEDKADLLIKLAHEFGHALNLDHVDDSKAIMYYLQKDQDLKNLKLTQVELDALNKECQKRLSPFVWQRNSIILLDSFKFLSANVAK